MPQLKGVIKTPTGEPLGGATITLTSLHNRAGILKSVFSHVTTQNGEYDFPVLPGVYSVRLTQSTQRLSEIGVIRVYEDSADGSLNDFLGATDIDLRPEALKKFEELAQQAQQSAEAAAESERQAGQHVADAQKIKKDCQTLADNVQQNAEAVAASKQHVEQLASEVELNAGQVQQGVQNVTDAVKKAQQAAKDSADSATDSKNSADNAALSEQNAQKHAQKAEQHEQQTKQYAQDAATAAESAENAKGEIDEILEGGYLKIKNNFQEIVDAGPSALAQAQWNLQISGVKNKQVIATPYTWPSRTEYEQRVHLPLAGAYGFGYTFEDQSQGRINFNEGYTASWWSQWAKPGRYYVSASDKEYLAPEGERWGIVDLLWLNGSGYNDASKVLKILAFYDSDGHLHIGKRVGQSDWSISWRKLASLSDVRAMLYSYIYNNYNREWRDPELGGLILASYQGTADGDTNIKVSRGQTYPGSRLAPVAIECQFTPSGTYAATPRFYITGCKSKSLPGTYISLSGAPTTYSDQAFVALFMRIV
ncbi:TPA: phage tail protein [Escherichia coli]|uniref:Phage tail protein n=4 Tax=Escherichia coli TaxID=562 RepID=A0A8S7UB54_ECOLX|nr:prophage tail fiber N-terminal domain-containing protein [Escherichia coli]AEJ56155.1 prophage tail fiber N-terminal family protein [Escherichia coli UMNF18]AEJ57810.1 prophage tail fiber N-terminal family protein [Escherichia coli UMNF18]EEQ2016576.1 phage tail protein [Escherichia coli]EEQ2331316.1 phage tail protein [Escherichia coli]EEQ2662544.1 phage tail protein [Escherichia coli]